MKIWCGVVTDKIKESRDFYVRLFGCEVIYDSDWFVLLRLGDGELGFLVPNHESQAPIFQPAFPGQGVFVAINVEDAAAQYERIQSMDIPVEVPLRDEPWGDRHFVVVDPNGIGVDVVQRLQD